MFELRPATRDDILELTGESPPFSFKGIAGVLDGEVIGVAGIYFSGGIAIVFSNNKENARKKYLALGIREVMRMIDNSPYKVYAATEHSHKLLIKLGFRSIGVKGPCGHIYEKVR